MALTVERIPSLTQQWIRWASAFSTSSKAIWAVFAAAVLLRMMYLMQAIDNPFLYIPQLDEEYYVEYGRFLAGYADDNSNAGFFMDPLYGYFLGGMFYLFGDNLFVPRLVQILSDSLTACLLILIGRRLWSPGCGMSAGLIYALYPVSWFYSLTLLKTTFTVNYAVCLTYLLVWVLENQNWRSWLAFGVLTGIGVYLRANLILIAPVVLLIILAWHFRQVPRGIQFSAAYGLGVLLVLSIAGLHNKISNDEFLMLPVTGGITLYGANNAENPEGRNSNPAFVKQNHPAQLFQEYRSEAERRLGKPLNDREVASYWRNEAFSYLFSSIWVLPRQLLIKFGHLISRQEIANNQSIDIAARFAPMLLPSLPFYSIVLALGVPGLLLAVKKDRKAMALLPIVGVVLVTSLVYFSSSRFRLPVVPVLILASTFFVYHLVWQSTRQQRYSLLIIAGLIFLVSLLVKGPSENIEQQEINLALAFAETGNTEKSLALLKSYENTLIEDHYYQRIRAYVSMLAKDYTSARQFAHLALQKDANDYGTMSIAGISALQSGDAGTALALFTNALNISGDAEFHYWIGKTQLALGNAALAVEHLQIAVKQLPEASSLALDARHILSKLNS